MPATHILKDRLLAIIGRRFPIIYDLVFPRFGPSPEPWTPVSGPWPDPWRSALGTFPQPWRLPAIALHPRELGAAIAAEFVHSAWLADRFGADLGRVFTDLDDWCPTRPKGLKLPPWWPPIPDPDPQPDWFIDFHLGFAARLTAVSVEGTRIGESIDKAIERSIAAIEAVGVTK